MQMKPANREPPLSLDSTYPLTSEQISTYQRDGFILLPAVASAAEVAEFRPLIQNAVREKFNEKDEQGASRTYGKYFGQVTNVWRRDEHVKPFVIARRFAGIAAALMGVRGVRLYHDQALFKPGGGPGTPWHQDQFYWPLDTMHTITMWMPLVDAPRESGTMSFAAGSHRKGSLLDLSISDESHEQFASLVAKESLPVVDHALRAGDATFHSGWTVHSAHANSTERMREVMTIIYFADGTRLTEPDSKYRREDLEAFHPGQKPGEIAASPLNPLLFP
jgi:ectoine hydroxylase-related dioxygenase (phytanoyl-CoA dioxygenase family)